MISDEYECNEHVFGTCLSYRGMMCLVWSRLHVNRGCCNGHQVPGPGQRLGRSVKRKGESSGWTAMGHILHDLSRLHGLPIASASHTRKTHSTHHPQLLQSTLFCKCQFVEVQRLPFPGSRMASGLRLLLAPATSEDFHPVTCHVSCAT